MMVTLVTSQNWPSKTKKKRKGKKPLLLLFDRIDGLKNRSGKCEGPGEGGIDRVKNRSGKCEGPGGIDEVKNRSGKWEGPGGGDRQVDIGVRNVKDRAGGSMG
jgi:hypothetical protein